MLDSARIEAAEQLLRAGRPGQAIGALRALLDERPNLATAHEAHARALEATGDKVGAEDALRAALALDPASASAATALGLILIGRRRADEAAALLAPFIGTTAADLRLLTAQAQALKSLGRLEEATTVYEMAVAAAPASGVAEYNLAAVLGDAHRFAESEARATRAMAKGLDAPEAWLVKARALQGELAFDEAESAFREALRRRPGYAEAAGDLAQLIWMRTEDIGRAREPLDAALRLLPADGPLSLAKAKLLEYVGDLDGAYAVLAEAIDRHAVDSPLHVGAAQLMLFRDPQTALAHAERAFERERESGPAATALCMANLAVGRADTAASIALRLRQDWPLDQLPVALLATAWRLLGDPRYEELYDYDRLIQVRALEAPPGWANLPAYLGDLAAHLHDLHRLRGHPIGQSLRGGAQTGQSLARLEDPVIKALFAAMDAPIREYIAMLSQTKDVLGRRATDGYRFSGAWSALLRPNGYHTDHLHPQGWISSACHIDVPRSVESGQEGWLKFGEPGIPTQPALAAERFVKPSPGHLVLFPSYMWHGTVPFSGETPRLSVAFDLLPS